MTSKWLAAAAAPIFAGPAQSAVIVGLFNTGVNAAGLALGNNNGDSDPHYIIYDTSSPGFPEGSQAMTFYRGEYVANDADSKWISLTANGTPTNNQTLYRTTFDLTGFDPATAQLTGLWGVDNYGYIYLNGVITANDIDPSDPNGFQSLHAFSIINDAANGLFFLPGVNTIDFRVDDVGESTALRVDNFAGTAELAAPGGVPEPATWLTMVAGFGLVGAGLRRGSRSVQPGSPDRPLERGATLA
jgi:hypothetical protein